MLHSGQLHNKVNVTHEPDSRLIYQDYTSSFIGLLSKNNSLIIHQRNLQKTGHRIDKIKNRNSMVDQMLQNSTK